MMTDSAGATAIFGQYLIEARKRLRLTAREVAGAIGMLPSNYSKLEHGMSKPPQAEGKLRDLGKAIQLKSQQEWDVFFELAAKASKGLTVELHEYISEEDALPTLLRTIKDKRLNRDQIMEIVEAVRKK